MHKKKEQAAKLLNRTSFNADLTIVFEAGNLHLAHPAYKKKEPKNNFAVLSIICANNKRN